MHICICTYIRIICAILEHRHTACFIYTLNMTHERVTTLWQVNASCSTQCITLHELTCDMLRLHISWHMHKWQPSLIVRDMTHAQVPWLKLTMGWLQCVGSLKLQVSFAEYILFYRALLQLRPLILRSNLIVATPYQIAVWCSGLCVLQCDTCDAACCSVLQCAAVWRSALCRGAVNCSVVQSGAMWWTWLQCGAVHWCACAMMRPQ